MTSILFLPGLLENADAFAAQVEALHGIAACSVADLTALSSIYEKVIAGYFAGPARA